MRLRRLGLAALVIAAVLLPLRKPEQQVTTLPTNDRGLLLQELSQELNAAQVRWAATAERDSALAALARIAKPEALPSVRLRGFPSGASASEAEATISRLWNALGPVDPTVGSTLIVYNGEAYRDRSWRATYSGDLITQGSGITWCIAMVPGELREDGSVRVGKETLDGALAPCALLAAFGPPGTGLRTWLDATRYTAARSTGWSSHPRRFLEGHGGGPWAWIFDPSAYYMRSREFSLLQKLGGLSVAQLLAPPYWYGAPGVRCIDGDEASCEEAVLHSAITRSPYPGFPHDLTAPMGPLRVAGATLTSARPPAEFFLSDLVRDQGREHFRAFWKADLSFEQGFATAFGEPLGRWTARWARRQWEGSWEAKYGGGTIILGANLAPSWPIVVLGWSVLALGAVAWAAKRKQVA